MFKIVFCLFLILELKTYSQTFPFSNIAPCDVTISYEVWNQSCQVCSSGTFVVNGNGGLYNLPVCNGWLDICISIIDIGGDPPPANHFSFNICHMITPYGQSGTTSTSATCQSYSWFTSISGTSWTFN